MAIAAVAFLVLVAAVIFASLVYGMIAGATGLAKAIRRAHEWTRKATVPPRGEQPAGAWPACWEEKNCPMLVRENCAAYKDPSDPCWLANLRKSGKIKPDCMGCNRFSMTDYVDEESPRPRTRHGAIS